MQTKQQWFLDFMGQPATQFTIPSYQRVYSWLSSQREELWEDIMRSGKTEVSHYMSTTLFLDAGTTPYGVRKLDIIDGQQRIASTSIVLCALRDYLRETGVALKGDELSNRSAAGSREDIDAEALHNRFLVVQNGEVAEAKIRLIGPDHTTLSALIFGTEMPERASIRVQDNYDYYLKRMHEDGFDAQAFWRGLRELLIIAAELGEGDKAQTIFEGLNTKGIPLTAADLMRNYLLVGKTREEQQRLYLEYWQPMEIMFEDDQNSSGSLKLNTGLRMWLAIRFKRMCISDHARTYHYFKLYMETEYEGTVEELLDEIRGFCYLWAENYKCNFARSHCARFDWAKKGRKTLVPPMERAADTRARIRETRKRAESDSKTPIVSKTNKDYETITFGEWEGEPIAWRVLKREGDEALLISERILDSLPYHSHYVTTTWAECSLRTWANGVFVKNAFTDSEAERLVVNHVHTPGDELWGTVGGDDTEDLVYLLSFDEAREYFKTAEDRMAGPTDYAVSVNVFVENGYCLWWLRSPGQGQAFASTVWPVGGTDTAGSAVGRPGVGFRPVIRIKL